jgi:hypothetical protein
MRCLGWSLINYFWCHIRKISTDVYRGKDHCEDTLANQRKRLQKKLNLTWFRTFSFYNCEEMKFFFFKVLYHWYSITAALVVPGSSLL